MSVLKVDAIQDTSGNDQYTVKAWVSFNGTGTVAINADGNVSSITDNGTGNYDANFSSSLTDSNYAWSFGCKSYTDTLNAALVSQGNSDTKSTSAMNFQTFQGSWTVQDFTEVNITVTR